MPPQRIPNAAFAASKCLGHFRLICVWVFRYIRLQLFRINLSETSVQLFLS